MHGNTMCVCYIHTPSKVTATPLSMATSLYMVGHRDLIYSRRSELRVRRIPALIPDFGAPDLLKLHATLESGMLALQL